MIAGEGPNELGDWCNEVAYQPRAGDRSKAPRRTGVLEALLKQVRPDGWRIEGGIPWKKIRKLKAGNHRGAEARNVLGLINEAQERNFDVVAFARDRDGDTDRERDFLDGIRDAEKLFEQPPAIIGGMAIERLESWVAAVLDVRNAEELSDNQIDSLLKNHGIKPKDGGAMVERIEFCGIEKAKEAPSLATWLENAAKALK
jgi:hypothetical protein